MLPAGAGPGSGRSVPDSDYPSKKPLSKLDALMQKGKQDRERQAAAAAASAAAATAAKAQGSGGGRDYWLVPGVVVKIMSKELQEHGYYKQKVRQNRPSCLCFGP